MSEECDITSLQCTFLYIPFQSSVSVRCCMVEWEGEREGRKDRGTEREGKDRGGERDREREGGEVGGMEREKGRKRGREKLLRCVWTLSTNEWLSNQLVWVVR